MKIFDGVTLSGAYSGNQQEVEKDLRSGATLFINYTKGDETSMELLAEYSSYTDTEGAEDWHPLSKVDVATGEVSLLEYKFTAAGKYKIEVPATYKSDKFRFSLKATGGTPTGTATVTAAV